MNTMHSWCKVKKAASYADVSPRTIEEWLKQGLKHSRLPSGTRLLKYEWIDAYLEGFSNAENHVDKIVDEVMADL